MDTRTEIREFLTTRRARLKAADVGLPDYGPRRVPGLRREEVAVLAGVSVPYYTRLERGDLAGASDGVLQALSRALRLDDAESAHLLDLARAAQPLPPRPVRRPTPALVPPGVQQVLDAMTGAAAHVGNGRHDILAANPLGRAVFTEMFDAGPQPNSARFLFLDPRAHEFHREWDHIAHNVTAMLRSAAGQDPDDRELTELIGELSTRSDTFRQLWARHDVRFHVSGVKRFHHREVGDLDLNYQRLDISPGLTMFAYTADPGSRSAEALALLGSLAATPA
jgi:hypothetical protein